MSLYHSCETCGRSVEFGRENHHDCEYGTKVKREIAALKAELETLKNHHEVQVGLAKMYQKQRNDERERNARLVSTLKKMVFIGTKGTSIIWPDKTRVELVKLANEALQSAANQDVTDNGLNRNNSAKLDCCDVDSNEGNG
jgi:hypothetical protein